MPIRPVAKIIPPIKLGPSKWFLCGAGVVGTDAVVVDGFTVELVVGVGLGGGGGDDDGDVVVVIVDDDGVGLCVEGVTVVLVGVTVVPLVVIGLVVVVLVVVSIKLQIDTKNIGPEFNLLI